MFGYEPASCILVPATTAKCRILVYVYVFFEATEKIVMSYWPKSQGTPAAEDG